MMFLTRWRLWAGAGAAILLVGYVGVLNVEKAALRLSLSETEANLDLVRGKYQTCNNRIANILERIESDASVPDDLGGFVPRPGWMLDN